MNVTSLILSAFPHRLRRRALVALLLAPLCVAQAQSGGSLLPDGTFEKVNSSGEWPIGWGRAKNVTWESEPGNYFLRLASPAPGTHVSIYHKIENLPADLTLLELSFRARVTGLQVGEQKWYDARVILNFTDASGKVTSAAGFPYFTRDTQGWEVVVRQIQVPPGSVKLEFMPSLFRAAAGVFDIDDLVLKPVAVAK